MSPLVPAKQVVLVHGWGGSYARTWQEPGWDMILADAGLEAIGVDLLGHGDAPKPHEPEAYADLGTRVLDALPGDGPVAAVGFSLGAMTLLDVAAEHPGRIERLVVAGIGANVFRGERDDRLPAAVESGVAPEGDDRLDQVIRSFVGYATQPGSDRVALAACLRRPSRPFTPERLAHVEIPVLVVLGDRDFAGPADPLVEALPQAELVTLRGVDHFRTTEDFGFIDAAVRFLSA